MNGFVFIALGLIEVGLGMSGRAANDPESVWKEIESGIEALEAPRTWREQAPTANEVEAFQKRLIPAARKLAASAAEFARRYPTNEHAGDGRFTVLYAFSHAVAAGDEESERDARRFVDAVVADKTLSEDERAKVFMFSRTVAVMKHAGIRFFIDGQQKFREEMDRMSAEGLLEAVKRFPQSESVYTFIVALAERSKGAQRTNLLKAIIGSEHAPPPTRTLAEHLIKGTRPYEIGKPVRMHFTALDGREVNLQQLEGKVVLIEFWNIGCGPCIAGMPEVKSVYERFRGRGFEVIGISLDDKEGALRRFLREKEIPWPQHFDGKGWANRFATQYGIFSIPTMWLIDKKGNLRVTTASSHSLSGQVEALLGEK